MPSHARLFSASWPGSSVHGDSPDKNTGVGCHVLLQGVLPTQGWNQGLLHCRRRSPVLQANSLLSEPPGKPFGTLNQPKPTVFQLRSQIWFQHLTKLRFLFLMAHRRKNSVRDKVIGKRWILQRETHSTEECGPSQRVSAAVSECVVSFYGLGNFTS